MAARPKKRLSKIENKLSKLEKLEIKDIICTICQSILIEPVTLPCFHDFCHRCFNGSIENNALCCPLCRLRIGSWLRTATKQKNLVNIQLWNYIQKKFSKEIDKKLRGEDIDLPTETQLPRLSEPGEIQSEYQSELKRLKEERLRLEEKQFFETELLIRKLHKEEEEAHTKYLDRLKQDELLAKQIHYENKTHNNLPEILKKKQPKDFRTKTRLKPTKIDSFLTKANSSSLRDSLHLQKEVITNGSTSMSLIKTNSVSPEMLPTYGKMLKSFIAKKGKAETEVWNKENGERSKKEDEIISNEKNNSVKTKNGMHSLLVSLPLPHTRIVQSNKMNILHKRNIETGSVDSMLQELCYFKPIEGTTPTSLTSSKDLPLKVPVLRLEKNNIVIQDKTPPSRDKYLEGLCHLRQLSLSHKLPSAFVIALSMLRSKEDHSTKCQSSTKTKVKKKSPVSTYIASSLVARGNKSKQMMNVDDPESLGIAPSLRRTRSMGSISKDENEITPKKKVKVRKFCSDRKPYLRSDTKKLSDKKGSCSPVLFKESINNNKLNLVVKNLSSPLEKCDVKSILQEQLRIERIIEQEQSDFEFAQKIDAKWNGRRQPRRAAHKRQVTMSYALRPAKKLKV